MHLAEAGVAQFQDSAGSLHATQSNFDGDQSRSGQIGPGQYMDGSDQHVTIPAAATQGYDRFTFCLWINTDESGSNGSYWQRPSLVGQSTSGYDTEDFGITTNGGNLGMWGGLGSGLQDDYSLTSQQINNGAWHQVCAVNNDSNITLWLNGGVVDTIDSGAAVNGQSFWLGGRADEGGGGQHHRGVYDELQISSTDRSDSWIETSYKNQNLPSDFYSVGLQEFVLE